MKVRGNSYWEKREEWWGKKGKDLEEWEWKSDKKRKERKEGEEKKENNDKGREINKKSKGDGEWKGFRRYGKKGRE